MKKTISVILAAVLLLVPMMVCGFAEGEDPEESVDETVVCTCSAETVNFIFDGAHQFADIHITPAVLSEDGTYTDVFLVALRGTGLDIKKTNNIISDFQSAFNKESAYLTLVRNTVLELVPEGANIIFTGHSLGGMVEQQLICEPGFTARYNIISTLTAGSPYIMTDASAREGRLIRLAEKYDIIPHLSPAEFFDIKNQRNVQKENGGYFMDPDGAHNKSYIDPEEWAAYDALGVKGGSAVITYNNADVLLRMA